MPIFGYNAIGVNPVNLSSVNMYGNFDPVTIGLSGNPVLGGNLVTAHAYLAGPPILNPATAQIGVYDATVGLPATWPLFATSDPFLVPVAAPFQWWVAPIAGALVAGNSYVAAVLANTGGAAMVAIRFDDIIDQDAVRGIGPGVFPDPLGAGWNSAALWSLFITYETNAYTPTAACACSDS